MAGIGQSSLPQSDQSSVWSNQYNMGRSVMNTDNVSGLTNKLLMDPRRIMDENGTYNQQMMQGRQQTGFQAGLLGSDGNGGSSGMNKQPFMNNPMSSGLSGGFTSRNAASMNYMQPSNSSVNSMDQMMMSSHRSSGNLMSPMYNGGAGTMGGQGSQQSLKSMNQRNMMLDQQIWEAPIGNFDNNEFPVLNKVKSGPNLAHMTPMSRQTQYQTHNLVNYQNVLKSNGSGLMGNFDGNIMNSGHHQHHQNQSGPSQEFSIQQEDFPALPVAQNPSSTQSVNTSSAGNTIGSSNVTSTASSNVFEQQQQMLQQSQPQLQHQQQQRSSSSLITPDPTTGNRSFAHTLSSRQLPPPDHSSASDIGSHQHNLLGIQRSVYGGNSSSPLTIDSTANVEFSSYSSHQSHHHIPQSMMGGSSLVSHSSQQQAVSGINIPSSNNSSQQQANLLKQHYQQIQHHPLQHHPLPLQPMQHRNYHLQQQFKQKKVIQIPESNYIAYIPSDMVTDSFGLIGLIKLINVNSSYDNLKSLAPGFDMILELNPDLNTTKDIYPSFVTPLTSRPSGRAHDMDFIGPREYRIRDKIREKLSDPFPDRLADETLFWIFYNLVGEECQLVAARTLMQRQWRFHNKTLTWITRDLKSQTEVVNGSTERGTFITWDFERCIKVHKQMEISMKDLETMSEFNNVGKTVFPFLGKKQIGMNNGSNVLIPQLSPNVMMIQGAQPQIIRPQNVPHPAIPSIIGGMQNVHNPSQPTNIVGVNTTNNSAPILKTSTNTNNPSQLPGPSLITSSNSNCSNTTSLIGPTSSIISSIEACVPSLSSVSLSGPSIQRGSGGLVNMNAVPQSNKNLTSASLSSNVINNQISSSTQ